MTTAYAAAKYVNAQLSEAGVDYSIPPQMMYNYTSARIAKNKTPLIKFDAKNGVDVDDLKRWTTAYVAKKLAEQNVVVEA